MSSLRYSIALDPHTGHWLVMEESSDFNGWVVLLHATSVEAAERIIQNMVEADAKLRAQLRAQHGH